MGRERAVNIVYPFCLTARKPLKMLAGGDPNGIAESQHNQSEVLSNLSDFGAFAPLGSDPIV